MDYFQRQSIEVNTLFLVAVPLLCILTFFSLSQRQRAAVIGRLRLSKRRSSTAQTPPRSISPEKVKIVDRLARNNDHLETFPPLRRHILGQMINKLRPIHQSLFGNLHFNHENFRNSILGWEEDFNTASPDRYIYSGFSVREIKALGDFPDYAALSGVPLPEVYHGFDIDKALPRPYRPFRWPYVQTMSLSKLEPNWWLELENTYRSRITERKELYRQHGAGVLQWLPGSLLACKELMEMSLQFLCARYPHYFEMHPDDSDTCKTIFINRILETTQVVQDKHPLLVLLDNVPEDFALMIRNPETGYYHFRAGVICSALGWNLASKIGLQLHEVHAPIPHYKEKMQFSMDKFFANLLTEKPIQRGSWGLEVDQPLYMPPGDPHEKYRESQDPDLTLDRLHLRVDWQTLRRLPLSGSVVFNFKAVFTPITEFADEPGLPPLVAKVCREGNRDLMTYKNTWHTEHVIVPTMDRYTKEQIEKGLIDKDWEVSTLSKAPFYPGWEEKWHRQQGF